MSQTKKDKKKQRVLHTRVSEELDEELREKAAGLGVSVSNLVRNILLNTVEMVEDLVADSNSIARAAGGESKKTEAPAPAESAPAESELLGWQTIILHRNALCDACNAILAKGTPGMVPVYANATSTTPTFRCEACALAPSSDEATSS